MLVEMSSACAEGEVSTKEDISFKQGEDFDSKQSLFYVLPNEIILHILNFVCSLSDVSKGVILTCRLFKSIVLDESIWQFLYKQKWKSHSIHKICLFDHSWRALFRNQAIIEQNWWRGKYKEHTIEGHSGAVRCLKFSKQTLITGGADKAIKVWNINPDNLQKYSCTKTIQDSKMIRCLQADVQEQVMVTAGNDSTCVKIWNLESGALRGMLDGNRGFITSLQLSRFGGNYRIMTAHLDGVIRCWDLTQSRSLTPPISTGHDSLRSLAVEDNLIVTAGTERQMRVWDLRGAASSTAVAPATPVCKIEAASGGNYCVQLHDNTIVSGSKGCISVCDMRNASKPLKIMKGHRDVVSCLQFEGNKLVTGSMDATIGIWDLVDASLSPSQILEGHESFIWSLQFDEDKIISAAGDQIVKIWDFTQHTQHTQHT